MAGGCDVVLNFCSEGLNCHGMGLGKRGDGAILFRANPVQLLLICTGVIVASRTGRRVAAGFG